MTEIFQGRVLLMTGAAVIVLGFVGLWSRRHLLGTLLSVAQVLWGSVLIAVAAPGGNVLALLILAVIAAIFPLGLAVVANWYRDRGSAAVDSLDDVPHDFP